MALESEGLADHHVRLAAGLADGVRLNRLALTLVGNTFVGHLLPSGALGGSLPVVVGQVSVPQLIDGFASLGFLLQLANEFAVGSGRAAAGLELLISNERIKMVIESIESKEQFETNE